MISRRVQMIFGAYRRDDFADPDIFLAQSGMVLERYPNEVIEAVSNPRTGIQRHCKFPPSIAEIVEFCESEVTRMATLKRLKEIQNPDFKRLSGPKCPRWNLFIRSDRPRYAQMLERTKSADPRDFKYEDDGIWIPQDWYM